MKKKYPTYYEFLIKKAQREVVKIALIGTLVLFVVDRFLGLFGDAFIIFYLIIRLMPLISWAGLSEEAFCELIGGEQTFAQVNQDYLEPIYEDKHTIVGNKFLLKKEIEGEFRKNRSVLMLELADIAWIYQTITQHRTNGIPSGKTYTLNIGCYTGNLILKQAKQDDFAIVEAIASSVPHFVFGFSPERQELFMEATSKDEFITRVAIDEQWETTDTEQVATNESGVSA